MSLAEPFPPHEAGFFEIADVGRRIGSKRNADKLRAKYSRGILYV
jgi:hypothetical protein